MYEELISGRTHHRKGVDYECIFIHILLCRTLMPRAEGTLIDEMWFLMSSRNQQQKKKRNIQQTSMSRNNVRWSVRRSLPFTTETVEGFRKNTRHKQLSHGGNISHKLVSSTHTDTHTRYTALLHVLRSIRKIFNLNRISSLEYALWLSGSILSLDFTALITYRPKRAVPLHRVALHLRQAKGAKGWKHVRPDKRLLIWHTNTTLPYINCLHYPNDTAPSSIRPITFQPSTLTTDTCSNCFHHKCIRLRALLEPAIIFLLKSLTLSRPSLFLSPPACSGWSLRFYLTIGVAFVLHRDHFSICLHFIATHLCKCLPCSLSH